MQAGLEKKFNAKPPTRPQSPAEPNICIRNSRSQVVTDLPADRTDESAALQARMAPWHIHRATDAVRFTGVSRTVHPKPVANQVVRACDACELHGSMCVRGRGKAAGREIAREPERERERERVRESKRKRHVTDAFNRYIVASTVPEALGGSQNRMSSTRVPRFGSSRQAPL